MDWKVESSIEFGDTLVLKSTKLLLAHWGSRRHVAFFIAEGWFHLQILKHCKQFVVAWLFDLKLGSERGAIWSRLHEECDSNKEPETGEEDGGWGDNEYDEPSSFFFDPLYFFVEVVPAKRLEVHNNYIMMSSIKKL